MAESRKGFAVFGLGRIGSIHVTNVISNVRAKLLYVIETDECVSKAKQFLKNLHVDDVRVLEMSARTDALEDKDVQAVLVCTPTSTHEMLVLEVLRAGKAVFCEKPLTSTLQGTVKCYDEATKLQRSLFCSFNRRFDPGHGMLIEKASSGDLGRIHTITSTSRDGPVLPPISYLSAATQMFHDSAIHDIDMVLKIAGEAPATVYAQANAFSPSIAALGDVDCLVITLKFPSGIIAIINIDRVSPHGYDQRLEVLGDKSMMISDNPRPTALQMHDGKGVRLEACYQTFTQRYAESYRNSLDHFIDVIEGKAELKVTPHDVVLTCKVADACLESFKSQQVVKLDNV